VTDLDFYEPDEGDGGEMSGGRLTSWIAARAGRKIDRSRTDNRKSIHNWFSSTTIINDNRRSMFPGRERRPKRWE
jgi:hypothetical protein